MIQFHRYQLPDESVGFQQDVTRLIEIITQNGQTRPQDGADFLLSMCARHSNQRMAAIAARMHFWGVVDWDNIKQIMPRALPENFLWAQEIVCCIGYERSNQLWAISEDDWQTLQGFDEQNAAFDAKSANHAVVYQPVRSGFFSVVENAVAAAVAAEATGKSLLIDLSGDWWPYMEPFEKIFGSCFEFSENKPPQVKFESMRAVFAHASITQARNYAHRKSRWYAQIQKAIQTFVSPAEPLGSLGTVFLRGGDKLRTETIMPPMDLIHAELKWLKRHCKKRMILSDDQLLGPLFCRGDRDIIAPTSGSKGGYHFNPDIKISSISILQNYLLMVRAKLNFSCPSSNIVNAAQWSRNDNINYSLSNPVYRYLLI